MPARCAEFVCVNLCVCVCGECVENAYVWICVTKVSLSLPVCVCVCVCVLKEYMCEHPYYHIHIHKFLNYY